MQTTAPEKIRLQKFLAHAGVCSRRKAEQLISQGRVRVNDQPVTEPGLKISPEKDKVYLDSREIGSEKEENIYIVLNKPEGYVTSCSQKKTKIILDLIDLKERIYPVGRLDKDSKGLVLLTNDGELHNRLSHPSFDHEKEYVVTCSNPVKEKDLSLMAKGIVIDKSGIKTRQARVRRLGKNKFNIILKQGRNRQIRKMVGKTGNGVVSLQRIRMADIRLGSLKEGQWRYLSKNEIKKLKD